MAHTKKTQSRPSKKKGTRTTSNKRSTFRTFQNYHFEIRDHWLGGHNVHQIETPNKGGLIEPKYLVFHYTAGRSAEASVNWLTKPDANASAHLVVGRDGKIIQLAPFNIKTWHAGRSHWDGLTGLNQYSIGIEMDNAGPLTLVGTKLRAWFGKEYPKTQAIHARHKLDQELKWWHAYTEFQITTALELAKLLINEYHLKEIVGHEDIAPDRKRDPGPAFPLEHMRSAVMGRPEDSHDLYQVIASSLNIRKGPGTEFEPVAEPLKQGTSLLLLEKRDRWSKVEVQELEDVEGWVSNKYIQQV